MDIQSLLQTTDHRPWPLPTGPWVMTQIWHNLLFAHWPLPPDVLQPYIPPPFKLDTFNGQAWLGVVPFRMSNVVVRHLPPVPTTDRFPELNVRTYVDYGGKPGVLFFSLDAASTIAVLTARLWFHLPYFKATMSLVENDTTIYYDSQRRHPGSTLARFNGTYHPTAPVSLAQPGSLDKWLTERYCLYTIDRQGRPLRGEIHHRPWPLQPAKAALKTNTMAAAAGIHLPDIPPLLHYAHHLEILIWPLESLV